MEVCVVYIVAFRFSVLFRLLDFRRSLDCPSFRERRPVRKRGDANSHCDVNGGDMATEYEYTPNSYAAVTFYVCVIELVFVYV